MLKSRAFERVWPPFFAPSQHVKFMLKEQGWHQQLIRCVGCGMLRPKISGSQQSCRRIRTSATQWRHFGKDGNAPLVWADYHGCDFPQRSLELCLQRDVITCDHNDSQRRWRQLWVCPSLRNLLGWGKRDFFGRRWRQFFWIHSL